MKKWLVLVIVIGLAVIGCERNIISECDDTEQNSSSNFADIQKNILTPSCAVSGCHSGSNPAAGLNLSDGFSYDALVSENNYYLIPGNSADSYLMKKLNGDNTSIMPPTGFAPLGETDIQSIADWIDAGVKND